jgi:hypothetical protein
VPRSRSQGYWLGDSAFDRSLANTAMGLRQRGGTLTEEEGSIKIGRSHCEKHERVDFVCPHLVIKTVPSSAEYLGAACLCGPQVGDGPPKPFGLEGLVISWVGPAPLAARVSYTDGHIFNATARVTGREIPKDFPEKYTHDLHEVELFNASISTSTPEVVAWHKRYLDDFGAEPLAIFNDYLQAGFAIFGTLMEYPPVTQSPGQDSAAAAASFRACSVVLQRAVLISDPAPIVPAAAGSAPTPRQTLILRSYMHSAQDSQRFVNFVPRGGLQMVYTSDTIWFPLELTRVVQEPASMWCSTS